MTVPLAKAESPSARKIASICDVQQRPSAYDGQEIEISGRVIMEFESFTVFSDACSDPALTPVWLEFGGDLSPPEIYCCGNHERPKGKNVSVRGQEIILVRDKNLENFLHGLSVARRKKLNGTNCFGEMCHLYRVSATLKGRFFQSEGNLRGYGHLGCCHLLVIEQVLKVKAERTRIPAGGEYECTKDTWNPDIAEAKLLDLNPDCRQLDSKTCWSKRTSPFILIAKHWGDTLDANAGSLEDTGDATQDASFTQNTTWTSPDLTLQYTVRIDKNRATYDWLKVSITREVCHAIPMTQRRRPRF